MATHSSILAWRIPWTEELGGLQSMGLLRVGQDWSDWAHTHTVLLLYFQSTYLFISVFHFLLGFPDSSVGKESACNAGDPGWISGSERSPGEGIDYPLQYSWASLVAQLGKNLPTMRETWVWSLGWEDPLEKVKTIPTPIFWPGEFHGLYSTWGCKRVGHSWVTFTSCYIQ